MRFLSALAVETKVGASTQNQALAALLFLYGEVLGLRLPWLDDLIRARRPRRLPVVLSRVEVRAILACLHAAPVRVLALRMRPATSRRRAASCEGHLRHQDGADTARPSGRANDDDLHPCSESRSQRCTFASGSPPRCDGRLVPRADRSPNGVLRGWPSQANTAGAKMMESEKSLESRGLARIPRLLLRGRGSSGWRCYTDLSKYR